MSTPNAEAIALIARLGLQPLPREGGYFVRTWTSSDTLANGRPMGTAIYFLLTPQDFSALHQLDADELWHFHAGDPIEHVQWSHSQPAAQTTLLGATLESGQVPQLIVRAGNWQGARLAPTSSSTSRGWAWVSCTMSPGWDEAGFTLGCRETLTTRYPQNREHIHALTRIS
jgi:predicted cupin superfamily sugar epimerase